MKNTKTKKTNLIWPFIISGLLFVAVLFVCFFLPDVTYGAESGYVNASDLNVRTKPSTSNSSVVGTISYQNVTILGSETDASGNLWYKISYDGGEYYIFGSYVTVNSNSGSKDSSSQTINTDYGSFEEQLARFPESYRQKIRDIHSAYPNYIFQADYVSMSYDEAVYQETLDHRKLVSMSADGVSWRSLSSSCYDWSTGTWGTYSGNWTDAGIDVIEYYMDPRNFLSTKHMYIFAQQTYTGAETRSGVESIVGSSFLAGNYTDSSGTHNYIDTIMQVAAESHVSPYVIAATLRIEQPYGGDSPLIDGSYGYYNFFNFAASGSDVVGNGIAYAKKQGWDTVYKSILGGAKGYYNGYLKYGQDTYFYKDYNVINGDFDHQYAQGAYDQIGSAAFLRNAISDDHNATMVLRIPVYTTMPSESQGYPPETSSLNPRYQRGGAVIARKTGTITSADTIGSDVTPVSGGQGAAEVPSEEPTTTSSGSGSSGAGSGSTGTTSDGNGGGSSEDPGGGASPKYSSGDANGDGKISALDYVAIKNHILGKKTITDADKIKAADANGDGKVSALDYVRIKNTILGR